MIDINVCLDSNNKIQLTMKIPEILYNRIADKIHKFIEKFDAEPTLLILSPMYASYLTDFFYLSGWLEKQYDIDDVKFMNMKIHITKYGNTVEVF